jgi:hypothetical protein
MDKNLIRFAARAGAAAIFLWGAGAGAVGSPGTASAGGETNQPASGDRDPNQPDEQSQCRKDGDVPAPGDDAAASLPKCGASRPSPQGASGSAPGEPGAGGAAQDLSRQPTPESIGLQVKRVQDFSTRLSLAGSFSDVEKISQRTPVQAGGDEAFASAQAMFDGKTVDRAAPAAPGRIRFAQIVLPHNDLAVDTDGGGGSLGDRTHKPKTSYQPGGKPLNGSEKSYLVVSPADMRRTGVRPGDVSETWRTMPDGRVLVTQGPVGDVAPGVNTAAGRRWRGEGSLKMHTELGNPISNANSGTIKGGVTTYVVPNTKGQDPGDVMFKLRMEGKMPINYNGDDR